MLSYKLTVNLDRSQLVSEIGRVLESIHTGVLANLLGVLESILGGVLGSILGV